MEQEKLFENIRKPTICLGPALTEFNPNFILECLSFQKPALIGRENGLSVKLPEEFLFDAQNSTEMEQKMEQFFDDNFCQQAIKTLSTLSMEQTWENVTDAHAAVLDAR
jgi:hypothetical protein